MVVCVQVPRFELVVAAGGREQLARGPVALAPETGREQLIGTASASAEAYGVRAGLRLGEALARCPELRLVTPDPSGVADEWDRVMSALEAIGAEVEPGPAGVAWFSAAALQRMYGGTLDHVLAAARGALPGLGARFGVAASRFGAFAAASRARARRPEVVPDGQARLRAYLAPLPATLLSARRETAGLPPALERFGVRVLGGVAGMPRGALVDRFGSAGALAHDLANGVDGPIRARVPVERIEEVLELPEAGSGVQLEQALGLLIDRLLARRERRGRTLRAVVLSAALVEGGTWRARLVFREPLADPRRMRLALVPRLAELPAPAGLVRLRAEGFGPPAGEQRPLLDEPAAARAARLREAVHQARAAGGPDAALRILRLDPDSRVPERRIVLTPWES